MKLVANVIGVLLVLIGLIWFFQGIGVIQGSFMSNTAEWTLIGILCIVSGAVLLVVNKRRQRLH